jgi:hypothetical protein
MSKEMFFKLNFHFNIKIVAYYHEKVIEKLFFTSLKTDLSVGVSAGRTSFHPSDEVRSLFKLVHKGIY